MAVRQLDFILWMQGFSAPWLDAFWSAVSALGSESFYLAAAPLVYWLLGPSVGLRLSAVFLYSMILNFYLKDLFQMPRPWQEHASVRSISPEPGYGFPSGHAQGNATVWAFFIARYRSRVLAWTGITLTGLVSLSRLYLGQHYPLDVIAGLGLGIGVVAAYNRLEGHVAEFLKRSPLPRRLLLGLAFSVAPLVLYREPDAFKLCGYLAGTLVGGVWEREMIHFPRLAGSALSRACVGLCGLAVLFAWLQVSRGIFGESAWQLVRYGVAGAWMSLGLPWLVTRTGWGAMAARRSEHRA